MMANCLFYFLPYLWGKSTMFSQFGSAEDDHFTLRWNYLAVTTTLVAISITPCFCPFGTVHCSFCSGSNSSSSAFLTLSLPSSCPRTHFYFHIHSHFSRFYCLSVNGLENRRISTLQIISFYWCLGSLPQSVSIFYACLLLNYWHGLWLGMSPECGCCQSYILCPHCRSPLSHSSQVRHHCYLCLGTIPVVSS